MNKATNACSSSLSARFTVEIGHLATGGKSEGSSAICYGKALYSTDIYISKTVAAYCKQWVAKNRKSY